MSNTTRKARKRLLNNTNTDSELKALVRKFSKKPEKVPTPLEETAWWNGLVPGVAGTKWAGVSVPRSTKKRLKAYLDRNPDMELEKND